MNGKYVKHNQEIIERFKEVINDPNRWYGTVFHFVCVNCGSYTTYPNFVHCGKDPTQVLCWDCQQVVRKVGKE